MLVKSGFSEKNRYFLSAFRALVFLQSVIHKVAEPFDQKLERSEFDLQLQSALSALPEKCRSVFLMSRTDELSNRQIAEGLGISVKAVEKQITRALKILRQKLERNQ